MVSLIDYWAEFFSALFDRSLFDERCIGIFMRVRRGSFIFHTILIT